MPGTVAAVLGSLRIFAIVDFNVQSLTTFFDLLDHEQPVEPIPLDMLRHLGFRFLDVLHELLARRDEEAQYLSSW